ncbi:hypothetical protein ACIBO9_39400 [Streptomyces prunicolor]|uniref:hypothetical protein n=1 Tax=Streptomyces prunicolor TaxID=67348 RepID=UPI0037CDB2C3
MKRRMPVVSPLLLFLVFLAGLGTDMATKRPSMARGNCLPSSEGQSASVTGTILMKEQRVGEFLTRRPVLWFLFHFNAGAGVGSCLALDGVKGIAVTIVMGLVALGAGFGLRQSPVRESARAHTIALC